MPKFKTAEELSKQGLEGVTDLTLSFDEETNKDEKKRRQEVEKLAEILIKNPSIITLDISGNDLDADETIIILEALLKTKSLQNLDISRNKMGDKGAKFLIEILSDKNLLKLKPSFLKTVIMEGNGITGQSVPITQEEEEIEMKNARDRWEKAEALARLKKIEREIIRDKKEISRSIEDKASVIDFQKRLKEKFIERGFKFEESEDDETQERDDDKKEKPSNSTMTRRKAFETTDQCVTPLKPKQKEREK